MSTLHFYKLQGTGNDFVAWDNRKYGMSLNEIIALTPRLCNRRLGIGADGVLVIDKSESADYTMIYRNADGSDAGMCGNGGRCIALLAHHLGYPADQTFIVHKKSYRADVWPGNKIALYFPEETGVSAAQSDSGIPVLKTYTGTEHIVLTGAVLNRKADNELFETGRALRNDPAFKPSGTNVNFILENRSDSISIKTYERGVEDFTLACGTGAIASALAWHHMQKKGDGVFNCTVKNPGGILEVSFEYDKKNCAYRNLSLTGNANIVFEGEFPL